MATKVVSTSSYEKETPDLVDSHKEAARIELESVCRTLIFSFINMKEGDLAPSYSDSPSAAHLLHPDKRSKLCGETKRGTKLGAVSSSDLDREDQSEGSSVDLVDSSVDLVAMAEAVQVRGDEESVRELAPNTLPLEIRDNISKVEEEDLRKLYDIDAGVQKIRNNELSTIELVVLHLRSYRNVLKFEISDMETFKSRFVGYFGSILADLMEACYPVSTRGPISVVRIQA